MLISYSYSLNPKTPLANDIVFAHTDTLKIALTTIENKKAARPHQAFLTLADADTGLEFSLPIGVKSSGKGKLDIVCGIAPIMEDGVLPNYLGPIITRPYKLLLILSSLIYF